MPRRQAPGLLVGDEVEQRQHHVADEDLGASPADDALGHHGAAVADPHRHGPARGVPLRRVSPRTSTTSRDSRRKASVSTRPLTVVRRMSDQAAARR